MQIDLGDEIFAELEKFSARESLTSDQLAQRILMRFVKRVRN